METLADIIKKYNPVSSPEDIVAYIKSKQPSWFKSPWEKLGVIPLNNAGYPLGIEWVSVGNETTCGCAISKVFKVMFARRKYASATAFVVVHNHPSGNTEPSHIDDVLTRKIIGAGRLMEFGMEDHLIISPVESFYSYRRSHNSWWEVA